MTPTTDRCQVFRRLHQSGCFVIPNPWDLGSARLLVQLGFPALATTSSGLAWSQGRPDNQVPLEQVLAHPSGHRPGGRGSRQRGPRRRLCAEPAAVGSNVAAATATGIAGLSIEDSTASAPPRRCEGVWMSGARRRPPATLEPGPRAPTKEEREAFDQLFMAFGFKPKCRRRRNGESRLQSKDEHHESAFTTVRTNGSSPAWRILR
jgi:hypothetical protein